MKFASLCVLAYKRPDRLCSCIESLYETIDYPCEVILNLDADNMPETQGLVYEYFKEKKVSKLILVNGKNRGVGRSFANCVGMAEGDYIFKIDTDLTFKPKWLSTSINILENNQDVGSVSLFNYNNYDPNDKRFYTVEDRKDCLIVNDFISSIYGFDRNKLALNGWTEDDGFHTNLGKLAITKKDMVTNSGFGVTKSTYVSGTEDHPFKTPTHNTPHFVFNNAEIV